MATHKVTWLQKRVQRWLHWQVLEVQPKDRGLSSELTETAVVGCTYTQWGR